MQIISNTQDSQVFHLDYRVFGLYNVDGNPVVYCKIKINDGYIYAMSSDQWELGEKLDELWNLKKSFYYRTIDGFLIQA